MTTNTFDYVLKNLHTHEFEEALLHDGILDLHIDQIENHWKPILQSHLSKLITKHKNNSGQYNKAAIFDDAGLLNIQDANWDWRKKYDYYSKIFGYSGCALVCNGMTQGVGYFDLSQEHKPKLDLETTKGIVYVEFISSAPWNRNQIENRLYAGIGESLIHRAIALSHDEGLDGCVGLHALPQSEGFYTKCGFTNLGLDEEKKMCYFEMTKHQAIHFLDKVK